MRANAVFFLVCFLCCLERIDRLAANVTFSSSSKSVVGQPQNYCGWQQSGEIYSSTGGVGQHSTPHKGCGRRCSHIQKMAQRSLRRVSWKKTESVRKKWSVACEIHSLKHWLRESFKKNDCWPHQFSLLSMHAECSTELIRNSKSTKGCWKWQLHFTNITSQQFTHKCTSNM